MFVLLLAGFLLFTYVFYRHEISIFVKNLKYSKSDNSSDSNVYKFIELDQEIAEKEKELNSLKELQKKEKKLNDLNNQIEQYSKVSKTLSGIGSTMEEIGQPAYNAEYGHIPIYISESNTNNKVFHNTLTLNGGIDLSKYDKNIIMTADEVKEKQKNTHWSDDKELLKVYEESKHKALKEIEELIQKTLVSDRNQLSYTVNEKYYNPFNTNPKQHLALLKLESNEYVKVARKQFYDDIIKELVKLGYQAQFEERQYVDVINIEW